MRSFISPGYLNKDSVKNTAFSRCTTQSKVEPSAHREFNIERDPASAGNAVVLGRKKHRDSTVTLMHFPPSDIKLIEEKKATNACYSHLRRVVNRQILVRNETSAFWL